MNFIGMEREAVYDVDEAVITALLLSESSS